MSLFRKFLSRLGAWGYLIYAGAASFVTAAKGYFYSHLLSESQYADINYYLLIVGVGVLFVGAGVIIRCHTELPLLVSDSSKSDELHGFLGNARGVGGLFWLALVLVLLVFGSLSGFSISVIFLSLAQVLLFFLFTVDILVEKSRKKFGLYAKQVFFRNALIAAAGLTSAAFWGDAEVAIASEVAFCAVLCLGATPGWVKETVAPSKAFFLESIKFVPVTVLGAVLQYVDRIFAAIYMSSSEFSRFSYFSLIVMVGLSVQQLINTRVITLLPALCSESPRKAFRYVLSTAGGVSLLSAAFLVVLMGALRSEYFAADWVAIDTVGAGLFVACATVRAADFFSSYLLVLGKRSLLIRIQIVSVILFSSLSSYYGLLLSGAGVAIYMLLMLVGFIFMLLLLFFFSWRASLAASSSS